MTVPAPMVTGCRPWKTTVSAIVAVGSAFRGAFGGPELWEEEERWVFVGGLRVAILVICVGGGLFGEIYDRRVLTVLELARAAFWCTSLSQLHQMLPRAG